MHSGCSTRSSTSRSTRMWSAPPSSSPTGCCAPWMRSTWRQRGCSARSSPLWSLMTNGWPKRLRTRGYPFSRRAICRTCPLPGTITPRPRPALRSQARIDGFGLEGEDGEYALVDSPERLAAGDPVERLEPERVLALRHRALVAESALPQPVEVSGLGVVGSVDDAQVLPAADLEPRLHQAPAPPGQVRGRLDHHAL